MRTGHARRINLAALCDRPVDAETLLTDLSGLLRHLVPFDGALWFGADPSTVLPTWPTVVANVEEGHCDTFWEREFRVHDANLFRDLARSPRPVMSLYDATNGRPSRSVRHQEFLAPQGYDDELRAAVRTGDSTWAMFSLFRERGCPPFTGAETSIVSELCRVLGQSLRARAMTPATHAVAGPDGPGVLMFDNENRLVSLNSEAERWLDELPVDASGFAKRTEILAVLAHARAEADQKQTGPAKLRLRSRRGQWVVVHASRLLGADADALIALLIEPAKAREVAPIIVRAYQLTPREQTITELIARGVGTAEIAVALRLSVHTVRGHIKAIFEKVGVTSRGELVAQLFAEHYASLRTDHGVMTVD